MSVAVTLLWFVNGAAAIYLSNQPNFLGFAISERLRWGLALFGIVFLLGGLWSLIAQRVLEVR